ncbi:MAG: hypothetical protein ABIO67_02385 [Mycobacteriales bacterium]
MAINDVGVGRAVEASVADFSRMAADGITTVSLYQYLYLPDPNGVTIGTGTNTLTDQEIELVVAEATRNNLKVHLLPILLDNATNTWRGRYVPSDLDAFFRNYTAVVRTYAAMAERLGVTMFYVGGENEQIAGRTAQWRAVIKAVRSVYHGAVSYMSTPYTATNVKFWGDLDVAGISAYFSMGEDTNPTYDRFLAAWREVHTPFVADLVKKIRIPLIYAEVGYHSQQHAFANPAESEKATRLAAPAAQADGYRALLDVLVKNPSVYGVTFWRWGPAGSSADTSYSPNGKPAECALAAHWSADATVRQVAAFPTCDLHALDKALTAVAGPLNPT